MSLNLIYRLNYFLYKTYDLNINSHTDYIFINREFINFINANTTLYYFLNTIVTSI
jgi:hypothetical protein